MALSDVDQQQVDLLRPLVGGWDGSDDTLHGYLTAAGGNLDGAAAAVWLAKAADAADLIDVKEGSSSRPLSQLRGAYAAQAAFYQARADAAVASSAPSVTRYRRLARP